VGTKPEGSVGGGVVASGAGVVARGAGVVAIAAGVVACAAGVVADAAGVVASASGVEVGVSEGVSTVSVAVGVKVGVEMPEFGSGVFVAGESKSQRASEGVPAPAMARVISTVAMATSAKRVRSRVRRTSS
jgi:hypothetical protein